jgi:arabinose-5-phosphate isomerase
MGDALAVCLMEIRDFKPEDFAIYHPGGALEKLLLRVQDMLEHTLKPMVTPDTPIKKLF